MKMKATVIHEFGDFDALKHEDIAKFVYDCCFHFHGFLVLLHIPGVHFYATEKAEMDFLFASKIDA